MDHDYALPARPAAGASSAKRKRTGEKTDPRRFWDSKRSKTRVNIGLAFPRWRELRDKLGLQRDADLACILINSYQRGEPSTSTPIKRHGMPVQTLSTSAPSIESSTDREHCFLEPGIEDLSMGVKEQQPIDKSFSKISVHDESIFSPTEDANGLQNTVIDWRDPDDDDDDDDDTWETASEASNLNEDYIPSICMRFVRSKLLR
ncbi:hypothetical protein UPYG_G00092270 [Umbra pygmaea]|uniref:Uncharacterized protein n=1 Tax=Umbra pygmaea TaxID=75934 RepID=A0ABD0XIY3_UMBPY